ncbi:hypothetical protein IFM89_010465 [Coptis chinensis]|uniref:CST complex subunit CTC1 n=1 Tax=Coptis chinensis TaxID=261450 RepID=A0A835M2U6_9MAGN|nr:hypothetical protein IFM89_010465 [Coptis chinensis]
MSKLVGNVVSVTGLKKKLIYIGKNDMCLMFITTEKAALCKPLLPLGCLPIHRDEIKGKADFGAYTGIVTGVYMQGMVIELDEKVWLLLSDRLLAPLHPIRVGALICLRSIHLVRPKFPWTRMLLLGACFRTNINVKSFSPLESQCYIRFQTQSMLGKFIESVTFSARFWLLLTISSFKKKFAGVFTEKEILGSKHKEGLAQMYAKSQLPSCVFRPRHGVFTEFCNHNLCGCDIDPNYNNLKLVVPISSFISHCEAIWETVLVRMQNNRDTIMKNNFYYCEGKSYHRLMRRIMSSEDIGLVLMGTLQISPSSGRLQMVDASGSIDVVVPDLPSYYDINNVYEVKHYSVVIEGLPEEDEALVMHDSESFSCKSIFHQAPLTRGIKPSSIYVHFYMKNISCLNFCLRLPCVDWTDNLREIKDGLFHIFMVSHKFPAIQKFHDNSINKPSSFVEAIILPWDLSLPGENQNTHVAEFSKENLKEHLECTCRTNSSEDQRHKKPKLSHGSTRVLTANLKDNIGETESGCDSSDCGTSVDQKSSELKSSHRLRCLVLMRSFKNQTPVRPGILLRANSNGKDGTLGKLSCRKIMLEFKSDIYNSCQFLHVGGYYVMKYGKELPLQNMKDRYHVTGGKTLVTSQTPVWSLSFSCDEVLSLSEPLQGNTLQTSSIGTDEVPCESSSVGELFFQRSPSQRPLTLFGDVNLHLFDDTMNLLKSDMAALEDGLVRPIGISEETHNSFTCMMGASVLSSFTADPDCRLPHGTLISIHGNIVDVHSFDCDSLDFKTNSSYKGTGDIQPTRLSQQLPSSICVHVSKGHQIVTVKLRGILSKHVYPIGMGPGVSATFHRVLVIGQHDLMLTPVSFIVINSIKEVYREYSDSFRSQFGSGILNAKMLDIYSTSLFSELIQQKAMRFRCRPSMSWCWKVKIFDIENSQSREQSKAPGINIPCAGFILGIRTYDFYSRSCAHFHVFKFHMDGVSKQVYSDVDSVVAYDGSLAYCCWANAERAATLLRLDEESMINTIRIPKRGSLPKSSKSVIHHLQKILKKHHRITVKNFGAMFDSSCQDFTFSNSENIVSTLDENFLKLIIFNACCGSVLNVIGSIMDLNAIRWLEELSGMHMAMDSMQNIWATDVHYADHRSEATNLIQELL